MQRQLKKVIFVSVIAMLFTGIVNTNVGIVGQVASQNGNDWVGTLSLSIIFFMSAAGSYVYFYIGRWSYRKILMLGGSGWVVYISFSVLFLFVGFSEEIIIVIIAGSVVCGFVVSLYYNGIHNYINECGKVDNQTHAYFGLSTCIFQTSNALGNTLSAFLIVPLGQQTYSVLMLGLIFLIVILFYFIKDPSTKEKLIEDKSQLDDIKTSKGKMPIWLNWCFTLSGIMFSFVYSQFSIAFYENYPEMEKEELNRLTFIAFMIEGFGQFIGGLLLFLFAKKIKSITVAYAADAFCFLVGVVCLWYGLGQQQMWIISIGAFLTGLANCLCLGLSLTIAGIWYEKGISHFNFTQAFTSSLLIILNIFVDLPILFLIYILFSLASSSVVIVYRPLLKMPESQQNLT